MKGHIKDNCYKIIGYLVDFKFRKKGVVSATCNVNGENCNLNVSHPYVAGKAEGETLRIGNLPASPQFDPAQYNQIMKLLNDKSPQETMANMKGIVNSVKSFLANVSKRKWIVNTGATNHMTFDLDMLTNVKEVNSSLSKKVHMPNGEVTIVTHTGDFHISKCDGLRNVLHILDFKYNLLSVSKVTMELNCFVGFYPDFWVFQDLSSGRVKGIGREKDGLYLIDAQIKPVDALYGCTFMSQEVRTRIKWINAGVTWNNSC